MPVFYLLALWLSLAATPARACDVNTPQVHQSGQLTWCANATFWAAHGAQVQPYFAFVDRIMPQLSQDFGLSSDAQFYIQVMPPVGYFSTPTPFGPGVNITGDAFYNTSYGIPGFYAYVAIVHEFVNQWTDLAMDGGGWPTDFWANHRSPFPNFVDPIVLHELGLSDVAAAQKARFLPGGDTEDAQVPMFTSLFDDFGGWPLFRSYFKLLQADGVTWQALRDPPNFRTQTAFVSGNPSPLLANYVVAYFNLAAASDVRPRFDAADVGQKPPNWPSDQSFSTYALDARAIARIATAHCRILAAPAAQQASARASLQLGNYDKVLSDVAASAASNASACTGGCTFAGGTCVPTYLTPPVAPSTSTPTAVVGDQPTAGVPDNGASNPLSPQGSAPAAEATPDGTEGPQSAGHGCSAGAAQLSWLGLGAWPVRALRRAAARRAVRARGAPSRR